MWGIIIFASLFVVATALTGAVLFRHFAAVAALDINTLPEIQTKQIKHNLAANKLLRRLGAAARACGRHLGPIARFWCLVQNQFRRLANGIADRYRELEWQKKWAEWRQKSRHERRAHTLQLLSTADEERRAEHFAAAEKKYVELISLDPKNINAYLGLGKNYFRQENWPEAENTFRFVVEKLEPTNDLAWAFLGRVLRAAGKWETAAAAFEKALQLDDSLAKRWVDLGECYENLGGKGEALNAYQKAVEREPNNPKTLDRLIEISIISGQQRLARTAMQQLSAVNPENQKLAEWEEKLREM